MTTGWSTRFWPTPGRSATGSMPRPRSCPAGPIPDSISSRGVPMAPAHPQAAVDRQVRPADPLLPGARQVIGDRAADRGQPGGERPGDRMPRLLGNPGDPDRAVAPAQRRVAIGRSLAALEVRQQILIAPARRPALVDGGVTAEMRHRVDRAGPAEGPAARVLDRPGITLRGGLVPPVGGRSHQFRPRGRHPHRGQRLGASRLEQQHVGAGILTQASCEHGTGRPAADDDVVVFVHAWTFSPESHLD